MVMASSCNQCWVTVLVLLVLAKTIPSEEIDFTIILPHGVVSSLLIFVTYFWKHRIIACLHLWT